MGSQETVAALPTSVTGDFYSPEALRRRLSVESVGSPEVLVLPASSSAKLVSVKTPPPIVLQNMTEVQWAGWAEYYGVRLTPAKVF